MSLKTNKPLCLEMPVAKPFLPLASAFVRMAAQGLALSQKPSNELALAAEEIVSYLVHLGIAGEEMRISCESGSCFLRISLSLPVRNLPLQAFNLTARVDVESEAYLDQMGLLIASRMVDRFQISKSRTGNLVLILIKEFPYPEIGEDFRLEIPKPISRFIIHEPEPAEIKQFVRLVNQCYPATQFPREFRYPGKIVDMTRAQEFQILLAQGPAGDTGGGIAWKWEGKKTVEIFGPYLFPADGCPERAGRLLDACIGKVARTSATVIVCQTPTPQLPEGYLEELCPANGRTKSPVPRFRMIQEDTGAVVFAHPELVGFLRQEYQRLVFPRDVQTICDDGEAKEAYSVLSTEIDRGIARAILRPVWPGEDCEENLANHVALLRQEAISSVSFEMDLGVSWHAGFTPGLMRLGFEPRMILPYAGVSDVVLFELGIGS